MKAPWAVNVGANESESGVNKLANKLFFASIENFNKNIAPFLPCPCWGSVFKWKWWNYMWRRKWGSWWLYFNVKQELSFVILASYGNDPSNNKFVACDGTNFLLVRLLLTILNLYWQVSLKWVGAWFSLPYCFWLIAVIFTKFISCFLW